MNIQTYNISQFHNFTISTFQNFICVVQRLKQKTTYNSLAPIGSCRDSHIYFCFCCCSGGGGRGGTSIGRCRDCCASTSTHFAMRCWVPLSSFRCRYRGGAFRSSTKSWPPNLRAWWSSLSSSISLLECNLRVQSSNVVLRCNPQTRPFADPPRVVSHVGPASADRSEAWGDM